MALTKCKECGNEISTKAATCPKCGAAQPKRTSPFVMVIAILFAVGFIQTIFTIATRKDDPPSTPQPVLASAPAAPTLDLSLYNKAVPSLMVAGRRISLGMTHDDFLARVGFKFINQVIEPDPKIPGSLLIFKRYREAGQQFLIEFGRQGDGLYIVKAIRIPSD